MPEPKTLSANQCRRDVEEEREALSDLVQGGSEMKDERERGGGRKKKERERASERGIIVLRQYPRLVRCPLTGMPTWSQETERYDL